MKPFGWKQKKSSQLAGMPNRNYRKSQSLLEYALVLPVLLLLILGIIEVGRLIFFYSSVFAATREATRYGAAAGNNPSGTPYYLDSTGIKAAAVRVGFFAGIKASDVLIWYDLGPDDDRHVTAQPYPTDITSPWMRVVVKVTAFFNPIAPLVKFSMVPVSFTNARTIMMEIDVAGIPPTPTNWPTKTKSPTPTRTRTITPTPTITRTPTHFDPDEDANHYFNDYQNTHDNKNTHGDENSHGDQDFHGDRHGDRHTILLPVALCGCRYGIGYDLQFPHS
jgi:Flp pilus assembly protein TadG